MSERQKFIPGRGWVREDDLRREKDEVFFMRPISPYEGELSVLNFKALLNKIYKDNHQAQGDKQT